ncbi:unnamed protein product [Rotaria socialis]|uniref:Uncharacterized protein n=1 Tax=Rotaria socialis TaxID=392032 RepID=A0A818DKK8_9BILA|nr:unnamed protein product [Rotaria socialis]
MSISITEKEILYDNPCAPIVKFSDSINLDDDDDDDDDMTDDQTSSNINHDNLLDTSLVYRAAATRVDGGVLCINDAGTLEAIETNQNLVPNRHATSPN